VFWGQIFQPQFELRLKRPIHPEVILTIIAMECK
jgi:hypothetical protein